MLHSMVKASLITQACEVAVPVAKACNGEVYVVTQASKVDTAVVHGVKKVDVQPGEVTCCRQTGKVAVTVPKAGEMAVVFTD